MYADVRRCTQMKKGEGWGNYSIHFTMRYIYIFFFSLLISGAGVFAQSRGAIVTIAGGGLGDGDNVLATDVALNRPLGIALDTRGNLYIADTDNHRIRRVDAITGIITTVAGTGEPGFSGDGGPATSALLNTPNAIAVDGAGNIYISSGGAGESDVLNRRIRRIDPSGIITTVAGTGEGGFNDLVPALQATFHEIVALTMLGDVALLISDGENGQSNNRVRQFNLANNTIGTIAGNGSAQASRIQDGGLASRAGLTPGQLALTSQGDLLIADFNNGRIRRVSRATRDTTVVAVINTVAGREATSAEEQAEDLYKGDGGAAISALFFNPLGVAVDEAGNVYIGDTGNNRIRVVEAETDHVVTIAGTGIAGAGPEDTLGLLSDLGQPTHLLVDGNGDLIFIDAANNRIRKLRDPTFRMPLFNLLSENIDFGEVSFGDPAVRRLRVENRGNVPVRVETAISDTSAFRVLSALPLEIGIAQTADIEIVFDPAQRGAVEGRITLTTDDPRTPSVAVAVQGLGAEPDIGLFPDDVLIFDPTLTGRSQILSVRIDNLGEGVLIVSNATTTDSQFVVEQTDTLRIDAGQSQQLSIAFRPQAEGQHEATLTIYSNALANPHGHTPYCRVLGNTPNPVALSMRPSTRVWAIRARDLARRGQISTTTMTPTSTSCVAESRTGYIAMMGVALPMWRRRWVLTIPATAARASGAITTAMAISISTSPILASRTGYIAMTGVALPMWRRRWVLTIPGMGMARRGAIMTAMGIWTFMSPTLARIAFIRIMATVFPNWPIAWA